MNKAELVAAVAGRAGADQALSADLSAEAAENFAAVEAAMLIISPVAGFRPCRAWRLDAENAPNPGHATLSPSFMASVTVSNSAPINRSVVA